MPATQASSSSLSRYVQSTYSSESVLFSILESNRDAVFGESTLWLPRSWLFERGAVGDLPDAFALDLEDGTWWMVQAELSRSPFWAEVVPRLIRRLATLENPMFRMWLGETALASTTESTEKWTPFHQWNPTRLGRSIRHILTTTPRLAVALDATTPVVRDWASTLRFESRLLEITRHVALGDPSNVCYRVPLHGSGVSTVSDAEDPTDDALPASRFLLVQRRERPAVGSAETSGFWRATA